MFDLTKDVFYAAMLKCKNGELSALADLSEVRKPRVLPILTVPKSGSFDHVEKRVLTPGEHISTFGSRLHKQWGRRLAFIDADLLDDDEHKSAVAEHPLTALLGRAHNAGGLACPVTSIGRSEEYQRAVASFVSLNPELPICLRVTLMQIQRRDFSNALAELLDILKCPASNIVFVVDVATSDMSDYASFADFLLDRLNDLPRLYEWQMLVLAMTSFPAEPKIKAGETKEFARNDWKVYLRLLECRERILRMPVFGDYGPEYPTFSPPGFRHVATQFRLTDELNYRVFKGASVKKEGYKGIFKVADRAAAHDCFLNAPFCKGASFIAGLSANKVRIGKQKTGNASTWRAASTNFHLTFVTDQISKLLDIPMVEPIGQEAEQFELLAR